METKVLNVQGLPNKSKVFRRINRNASFSLFFSCKSKGVLRIQSNIYDGTFLRKSLTASSL